MSAENLSEEQWQQLCRDGVLHVPDAFSEEEMQTFNAAIDDFYDECPYGNDDNTNLALTEPLGDTIEYFAHMPLHDSSFISILDKPIVHNTLERMLGKGYYINTFPMRRVPPGAQRMPYHRDNKGGVTCAILTTDIGPNEGATTIVPGTHLGPPAPLYCLDNTLAPHPDEVQAIGKAGDVYFFLLECWHARSENTSNRRTGIMLPDFVNHSTEIQAQFLHKARGQFDSYEGALKHALRPFEDKKANKLTGWIDKWIYRHHPTEYFFHNLLFFMRTYRGRFLTGGVDDLPPYTSAVALEQSITFRQCFRGLSPWLFIRRYLISMTLNRTAVRKAIRRLIGKK